MKETQDQLFCSFCGKPKELVGRLVAGPNGIFICDECIEACRDVIRDDDGKASVKEPVKLLKPVEIKDALAPREAGTRVVCRSWEGCLPLRGWPRPNDGSLPEAYIPFHRPSATRPCPKAPHWGYFGR